MKIVVLGSGGVGGYFGARLAAAGYDVTFVARGKHLEAMRESGLKVTSPLGDILVERPQVTEDVNSVGKVDLVLVSVKLWDTESVAASLRPLVDRGASVISFQNGVHKDEILARHIPAESIIGGVCYIAAVISAPGHITHSGTMQKLTFGEYDGSKSERVSLFYEACKRASITAEISDNIKRVIWEKFVFLVGLSGTTASIRKPIGPIRENPVTREFLREVMAEVVVIARAKGVEMSESFSDDRLAFCDSIPAGMTSSMHHDLENGNRLELPWLSGGVAEFGAQLKIATPRNKTIAEILELHVMGKK
ncbi:ketopantoate reductase family protein [Paraburkholderia flagellata]|uniref:ketopantoate reductase family protein n=1 Tax=Paraburkholderia flagellata TaxID=2883241 RepID=UPI001F1A1A6A|nr:2-dehydropantoate 2-reductase [Paraburkholderia flagellata]